MISTTGLGETWLGRGQLLLIIRRARVSKADEYSASAKLSLAGSDVAWSKQS
jgi:hypothetical protein